MALPTLGTQSTPLFLQSHLRWQYASPFRLSSHWSEHDSIKYEGRPLNPFDKVK